MSEDWLLVPIVVASLTMYLPDVTRKKGGILGMGDTTPTFFFSPANAKKIVWGVGPSLLMPQRQAPTSVRASGDWSIDSRPDATTLGISGRFGSEHLVVCWGPELDGCQTDAFGVPVFLRLAPWLGSDDGADDKRQLGPS